MDTHNEKTNHLRSISIRQLPSPPYLKPQCFAVGPGRNKVFYKISWSQQLLNSFSLQAARLDLGLSKTNKMKQSVTLNPNNNFSFAFLREGTSGTCVGVCVGGLPLWVTGVLLLSLRTFFHLLQKAVSHCCDSQTFSWDLFPPSTPLPGSCPSFRLPICHLLGESTLK